MRSILFEIMLGRREEKVEAQKIYSFADTCENEEKEDKLVNVEDTIGSYHNQIFPMLSFIGHSVSKLNSPEFPSKTFTNFSPVCL